jgi:hypothetical protein
MADDEIDLEQFTTFDGYMLLEASMTRVFHHTRNSAIAIISSQRERPRIDRETNRKMNNAAHSSLKNDLEELRGKRGFGYIPVQGGYVQDHGTDEAKDVRERSFMIVAHPDNAEELKKRVKELGAKYDQDSILFKHPKDEHASLIGTNSAEFPGKDQEVSVGKWHPRRIHEFFTTMRKAREYKDKDGNPIKGKTDRKEHSFSFAESVQEGPQTYFACFVVERSPTIRKVRLY